MTYLSLGGGSKVDCRACSFQSPNRYCKKVAFSICFVFTKQGTNCPSNRNHPVFSLVGFFLAIWNRKHYFIFISKLSQTKKSLVILMVQTIDFDHSKLFGSYQKQHIMAFRSMTKSFSIFPNFLYGSKTILSCPNRFGPVEG